jgi:hypothetical protein
MNRKKEEFGFLDPTSPDFIKGFPTCAPSVLRQKHSVADLAERAREQLRADAKSVQAYYGFSNSGLIKEMTERCIDRLFGQRVIDKFDPSISTIEAFRWGVMRNATRELLREWSQRRMDRAKAERLQAKQSPRLADAHQIAEKRDLIDTVRRRIEQLPVNERNAIARRFEAVADLDNGAAVNNECVARFRGLSRLREQLGNRDKGRG